MLLICDFGMKNRGILFFFPFLIFAWSINAQSCITHVDRGNRVLHVV
jgi:hypothetical protein